MNNVDNNNERHYTVYMHKNKTNGKVYIGITSIDPIKRWGKNGSRYNHNNHFINAIKKYGWDGFEHIILYEELTKTEAEQLEVDLIKEYNSTNEDFGYNIQNGGNSKGKTSDSVKRKIGLANSTPVYQYDRFTGEFIEKYQSISDAGRILNIHPSSISSVCNKKAKSIGGYIFRHVTEDLIYGEPLILEEYNDSKNTHMKPIIQYDKNGNFIAEYPSIKDAELSMGKEKGKTLIWHCCNGKKPSALGYIWCYKGEKCVIKEPKNVRRVNKLTIDGIIVETFNSVKEAAESIGRSSDSLIKICKQDNKIYKGYIWKYAS